MPIGSGCSPLVPQGSAVELRMAEGHKGRDQDRTERPYRHRVARGYARAEEQRSLSPGDASEPRGSRPCDRVSANVPDGVCPYGSPRSRFFELTTEMPHAVDIDMTRGAERPRIDYPLGDVFWFSGKAFSDGITTMAMAGQFRRVSTVRRYRSPTSLSIATSLGLEVAFEALRTWRGRRGADVALLIGDRPGMSSRAGDAPVSAGTVSRNVAASLRAQLSCRRRDLCAERACGLGVTSHGITLFEALSLKDEAGSLDGLAVAWAE